MFGQSLSLPSLLPQRAESEPLTGSLAPGGRQSGRRPGEGELITSSLFRNTSQRPALGKGKLPDWLIGCVVCLLLTLVGLDLELLAGRNNTLPPVIFISVDTLRADHLGCYGSPNRHTPNIDSLLQGGTRFSSVNSQVPLTLPSHVSMLTSTYPFANGVEDNGQPLVPTTLTLAAILKSRGYRTAAFVGSFVLDRRFGLHRGFDFYDSPFNLRSQRGTDPGDVKRLGEQVVESALRWLESNDEADPFFLFLHLYDLHQPYDVPSLKRSTSVVADYDAALAYEDRVLGTFLDSLRQKRILNRALIIFTSDHGESLGEHGESTHGYFIYQSTLHVPLIVRWPPGSAAFAPRVDEPAGLIDIAPTILQFLKIPRPQEFQGRGLLDLATQKGPVAPREVVSESLYARNHFGCSLLASLRLGNFKYVAAPKPELYDLSRDPREEHNLHALQTARARALSERLDALRSRYQGSQPAASQALSPEATAALNSLGYAAVSTAKSSKSTVGADPKDRIVDFESNRQAVSLSSQGRLAEAAVLLERLCLKYSDVPDLLVTLGVNRRNLGKHEQAAETFRKALAIDPLNVRGHFDLAVTYYELRRWDEALKEVQLILTLAPYYSRAAELAGEIRLQKKELEEARAVFTQMLTADSGNYAAHYHLGMLATGKGDWSEAERHFDAAARSDPLSAEAHNGLGVVYLQTGRLELAQHTLQEAARLEPKWAETHFNLGLVFRQLSQKNEAEREFRAALAADPQFRPAREALNSLEFRAR
jgi:choline-sulfatase